MSAPISLAGDPVTSVALATEFGLSAEEWEKAVSTLGRKPTYAELGVISVMWSEHCSYKSSRVHLKRLPTTGPKVVQGPGENAGAVDIGDGFCAVFKMESHNHPSFIEPYQGAATGVGGILRDVFTMGARPMASLNSLRFGAPEHPKTARLLRGVAAGIGGYGNSIGVPTVGGEVQFDASYNGNILVNAFTVGIARSKDLFFGKAAGIGNPVLYVGAKTGRDGIHGATMASAEFDETAEKKLPTVQVGDPFMEKLLLEACLEIFKSGALAGVQDMGAAGLTSSSVEMAARAENGIELDLDAIPRRTTKLSPYEMLLSESQERMLMVAHAGREHEVLELCKKRDLDAAVVGRVTDTKRFVCLATPGYDPLDENPTKRDPKVVVDLPTALLTDDAPMYDRPQSPPAEDHRATGQMPAVGRARSGLPPDVGSEILKLLASPNIGSRAWIYRQYDHIVRVGTVMGPGSGDAAVVRAFCEDPSGKVLEKFLALSVDCNGRQVQLDPYHGGAMTVAECARNVSCVGAVPLGLTDCLNFGNPQVPETMWRFSRAIDGLRDACLALSIPVVSGNVSLYNETEGRPILPTPTVAIVGLMPEGVSPVGLAFPEENLRVALIGPPADSAMGASEWFALQVGRVTGELPRIDLQVEKRVQETIRQLVAMKAIKSAHDISDGGLAIALAECVLKSGIGATVVLPETAYLNLEARLFNEAPSRILISYPIDQGGPIRALCERRDVPLTVIGTTGGRQLHIEEIATLHVEDLRRAYDSALTSIVGRE